jgi:hypothetical protein
VNARIRKLFAAREPGDREAAYQAFLELMKLTEKPVSWSYDVWDRMLKGLSHEDGHQRAFAAQMLAHLAISDPEDRMRRDFAALAAVMRDDKTVTARHALQSIWRVGLAGKDQRKRLVEALAERFGECRSEKNGTLVRTDVITALGQLFRAVGEPAVETRAEILMASETDPKAQRKQRACWRKATA